MLKKKSEIGKIKADMAGEEDMKGLRSMKKRKKAKRKMGGRK